MGGAFGGAVEAVHAAVFPFDREWAGVADVIEGDHDFLEIDVAATHGTEVPVAAGVGEIGVASENADASRRRGPTRHPSCGRGRCGRGSRG